MDSRDDHANMIYMIYLYDCCVMERYFILKFKSGGNTGSPESQTRDGMWDWLHFFRVGLLMED